MTTICSHYLFYTADVIPAAFYLKFTVYIKLFLLDTMVMVKICIKIKNIYNDSESVDCASLDDQMGESLTCLQVFSRGTPWCPKIV